MQIRKMSLALLLLCVPATHGQGRPTEPGSQNSATEPKKPLGQGSVTGTVIDPQSMQVGGATVTMLPGTYLTETSSSGQFGFNGVPAGNYTVTVSVRGYQDSKSQIRIKANESVNLQFTLVNER